MIKQKNGKKLNVNFVKWFKRTPPKLKAELKTEELCSQFRKIIRPSWVVEDLAQFLPVSQSGMGIEYAKNKFKMPETFVQNVPGCYALVDKITDKVLYVGKGAMLRSVICAFFSRWKMSEAYVCVWKCQPPHNELLKMLLIIYYDPEYNRREYWEEIQNMSCGENGNQGQPAE